MVQTEATRGMTAPHPHFPKLFEHEFVPNVSPQTPPPEIDSESLDTVLYFIREFD